MDGCPKSSVSAFARDNAIAHAPGVERFMEPAPYTDAERKEEDRRVRRLQRLVDFSLQLIAQSNMPMSEAHTIIGLVKRRALDLFPDKEATFDLLYTPRFRRLVAEKYGLH